MNQQTSRAVVVALVVVVALAFLGQASAQELGYRKRDNRFEGIKAKPVSGFDIELLSAMVDYQDQPDKVSGRFGVRFFLERSRSVHLVVRELDYKHYYWLDQVQPEVPWEKGFRNKFEWPTREVVQQLKGLTMNDLGVVARLDKLTPAAVEQVAPVVFYQTQVPKTINGYVFAFRVRDDTKIKSTVYRMPEGRIVSQWDMIKQHGGRPFFVRWVPQPDDTEGNYKVAVAGYVLSTNDPVRNVSRTLRHRLRGI
jgi:hypothetical protein